MTAEKYTIPPIKTLEAFTALSDLEQEVIRIVQISGFMLDIRTIAQDGAHTAEWKSARIKLARRDARALLHQPRRKICKGRTRCR
jgi:hypothetical protein